MGFVRTTNHRDRRSMSSIDLGCGERKRGEIGVDFRKVDGVDVLADVSRLPFRDGVFQEGLASDILEHFPRSETLNVLREWRRILAEGGKLIIKTPNLGTLASAFLSQFIDGLELSRKLFGNQGNEGDFHKSGFDPRGLEILLFNAGFKIEKIYPQAEEFTGEPGDWSNQVAIVRKM